MYDLTELPRAYLVGRAVDYLDKEVFLVEQLLEVQASGQVMGPNFPGVEALEAYKQELFSVGTKLYTLAAYLGVKDVLPDYRHPIPPWGSQNKIWVWAQNWLGDKPNGGPKLIWIDAETVGEAALAALRKGHVVRKENAYPQGLVTKFLAGAVLRTAALKKLATNEGLKTRDLEDFGGGQ